MCWLLAGIIFTDIDNKKDFSYMSEISTRALKRFPEFRDSKPRGCTFNDFWYLVGSRELRLLHVRNLKAKLLKK